MYVYVCVCVYIYIYIYAYIHNEVGRAAEAGHRLDLAALQEACRALHMERL